MSNPIRTPFQVQELANKEESAKVPGWKQLGFHNPKLRIPRPMEPRMERPRVAMPLRVK